MKPKKMTIKEFANATGRSEKGIRLLISQRRIEADLVLMPGTWSKYHRVIDARLVKDFKVGK